MMTKKKKNLPSGTYKKKKKVTESVIIQKNIYIFTNKNVKIHILSNKLYFNK